MSLTAREILTAEYGDSKNFMTPHAISRGKVSPNIAYELSSGEGLSGEDIYGVSVVGYFPETRLTKAFATVTVAEKKVSDCFMTKEKALRHIEWLKFIGEDRLLAALKGGE